MSSKKILVCLTGASGSTYGVRLVKALNKLGVEIHLIISKWGSKTLEYETGVGVDALSEQVDYVYEENDLTAGPASGSFHIDGMVIIPCSMKTMAAIANGFADNLVSRAADCSLKEKRTLIIVPREAPLNLIHVTNMKKVVEAGAIVFPASPAFWHKPTTIEDLVDGLIDRILTHLGVKEKTDIEWTGE
jgi:4-hydroxy-3-polyprenylbenzoate decarboxylase